MRIREGNREAGQSGSSSKILTSRERYWVASERGGGDSRDCGEEMGVGVGGGGGRDVVWGGVKEEGTPV